MRHPSIRPVRSRHLATAVAVLVMASAAGVLPSTTAHATKPTAAWTPTPAQQSVVDRINTLGVVDFPTTYLTVKATSATTLTVSDTVHDAAFFQAIGATGYTIAEQRVARSYATLDALIKRMADDRATLAAAGTTMASWGLDLATDKVTVTLAAPATATRTALATAGARASTQRVLDARYGAGLTAVSSATLPATRGAEIDGTDGSLPPAPLFNAERDMDYPPLSGGGLIHVSNDVTDGNDCTAGFATTASDGTQYMLTAGHCGVNVITDNTTGSTAVNQDYANGWDVEAVKFGTGASGTLSADVWWGNQSTDYYKVTGISVPEPGDQVTFDGAPTSFDLGGQITNNTVDPVTDTCYTNLGNGLKCHISSATRAGVETNCEGGDSGGPVYQRSTPLGTVNAVGIIVDRIVNANNTTTCYWQEIDPILNETGLKLYTAPVHLQFRNSGKCLDDPNGSTANGTWLDQQTCASSSNQEWYLDWNTSGEFDLRNVASNKCANIWQAVYADDTHISTYICGTNYANEYFQPYGVSSVPAQYQYFGAETDTVWVLNVAGGSTANGAHIILYTESATSTNEQIYLY